jgi:hypothetical protein
MRISFTLPNMALKRRSSFILLVYIKRQKCRFNYRKRIYYDIGYFNGLKNGVKGTLDVEDTVAGDMGVAFGCSQT